SVVVPVFGTAVVDSGPARSAYSDRDAEHPRDGDGVPGDFDACLHASGDASAYPASSIAERMASSVTGSVLVTVSPPLARSTFTSTTPATSDTSSVTEATQCSQVMPVTV